jgi:hypothetical protein
MQMSISAISPVPTWPAIAGGASAPSQKPAANQQFANVLQTQQSNNSGTSPTSVASSQHHHHHHAHPASSSGAATNANGSASRTM